jgi:hypothetical protein
MSAGLVILVVSVLVIFVFGVLLGYRLSERKLAAQERRQVAAQSSLYRQLRELQAARQETYSTRRNVGSFS